MVWSWLRKLFIKEEEGTYEEIEVPEYESLQKKPENEPRAAAIEEPRHKEPSINQDHSFKRYICGLCFRWSDFKEGTFPSSCPHCGNTNKTSFKPQRTVKEPEAEPVRRPAQNK